MNDTKTIVNPYFCAIFTSPERWPRLLNVIRRGLNTYPDDKERDELTDLLFPVESE